MKVVIDTNVVVSAHLSDEGMPAAILDLAANRTIRMCVSPAILEEYQAVLRRPRLKIDRARIACSLSVIMKTSRMVKPSRTVAIASDEPDNRFIECVVACGADYIVTGNTRHFPECFEGIRIVTPKDFIEVIVLDLGWGYSSA